MANNQPPATVLDFLNDLARTILDPKTDPMERQQIIKGYAKNLELKFGAIKSDDAVDRYPITLGYGLEPVGILTLNKGKLNLPEAVLGTMILAPGGIRTGLNNLMISEWAFVDGQRYAAGKMANQE